MFVDTTGRRRRLGTGLGVALGIALVTGLALLMAGLLGASPVPLPGLPAGGQGGSHHQPDGAEVQTGLRPASPSPGPASGPPAPSGRAPGAAEPSASAGPASATPSASRRGNRPTDHPGNPKASRSR